MLSPGWSCHCFLVLSLGCVQLNAKASARSPSNIHLTYCPHTGLVNQLEQLLSAAYATKLVDGVLHVPTVLCQHVDGPRSAALAKHWSRVCYSSYSRWWRMEIEMILDLEKTLGSVRNSKLSWPSVMHGKKVVELTGYRKGYDKDNNTISNSTLQHLLNRQNRRKAVLFTLGSAFHLFPEAERAGLRSLHFSEVVQETAKTAIQKLGKSFRCAHIRTGSTSSWDGKNIDLLEQTISTRLSFYERLNQTLTEFFLWLERMSRKDSILISTDSKALCQQRGVSKETRVVYIDDLLRDDETFGVPEQCTQTFKAAVSALMCSKATSIYTTRRSHFSSLIRSLHGQRQGV